MAPFREDGLSENWVAITAEHGFAAEPWWSPGAHCLYFIDSRDGFPCIWGRNWNSSAGKPEGDAFPVQAFRYGGAAFALQFHPDSKHLISAGFDGTVRIYDLSGKMEQDFIPVPLEKAVVSKK